MVGAFNCCVLTSYLRNRKQTVLMLSTIGRRKMGRAKFSEIFKLLYETAELHECLNDLVWYLDPYPTFPDSVWYPDPGFT